MSMFGLDADDQAEDKIEQEVSNAKEKRKAFAYWNIRGTDYTLKLTTEQTCKLEEKYRCNLLTLLMQANGGMPPLGVMLTVIQAAITPWHHGVKYKDIQKAFDAYVEDGGTQLTLFSDVIMQILMVSGFFTENQQEEMTEKLEEVKDNI